MKTTKNVKIVRVTKGNEAAAAAELEAFYNEMAEKNGRTSRAVSTVVGDDVLFTVFADVPVPDPASDSDSDEEDTDEEDEDDGEMHFRD